MDWLFPLALITLAMGVIGALGADNLKSLTAWQVIISVGTLLAPIALGSAETLPAAWFFFLTTPGIVAGSFLLQALGPPSAVPPGARLITGRWSVHPTFRVFFV